MEHFLMSGQTFSSSRARLLLEFAFAATARAEALPDPCIFKS
jgi:hypothetical protein